MTTERKMPSIADIRERIAGGLSTELLAELPRMTTMRIHAHGDERVSLFMIASACRFLSQPLEQNDDEQRLTTASERFVSGADALLEGVERGAEPAELYGLLDRFVTASAAANRSLAFGEGAGHP